MNSKNPCTLRRLELANVHALLNIIRGARQEYALENRVTALLEPADYALFDLYRRRRTAYFVAIEGQDVVGGAGMAPLIHGDWRTCELQRMYLKPESRGRGIGQMLLDACIRASQTFGFTRCYAETVSQMRPAIAFYERNGFRRLDHPLGQTGHGHNDRWMVLDIPGVSSTGVCAI